ncbi:hypothetical protein FRC98_18090 [Lujinxingia vulgaris]|uniref:Uncharacterized protein n=1 Tax=Lujinxingia vulgaris TaxID=2600176 RepID=A0A5C6WYY3_9DELT|nr:hypothetical protein [Lujinxingia vulgaris]TXD34743.1 hypothetical protein FRC98_18090 [Lujinxingia vulgaris]
MILKTLRRLSAALLLSLTLSACGDGDVGQCEAYPACNADQTEVESCDEGDESCHENTLCGSTIYCQDTPTDCTAVPQCEVGDSPVDNCSSVDGCYSVTECGATIICERVEACQGAPVCNDDDIQVDACPDDSICYDVTECGTTIICQTEHETCDGIPECDEGDTPVETCPADASCYEREACGESITCQVLELCEALPECDPGDTPIDTCPDDASCYEREACGTTITCEEAPGGSCAQSFECPDTHQNTPPCTEWGDCMSFYGCGEFQLLCSGEQRTTGCRAAPVCPEGFEITEEACTSIEDPCVEVTVCDTTITCSPALTEG